MNTKKVSNSFYFPSVTYSDSSDKWFRSYRILRINFAAEFCFWTEQQLKGTELLGLGMTKTLEVQNTIMVCNSLSFLVVYKMAPNDQWFKSYDCRKLDRSCWIRNLGGLYLSAQVGIWQNFAITFPERWIWKLLLTNSDSCWLLIRPILMHGLIATGFSSQDKVLNGSGQNGHTK
jgi:hypothetical protein